MYAVPVANSIPSIVTVSPVAAENVIGASAVYTPMWINTVSPGRYVRQGPTRFFLKILFNGNFSYMILKICFNYDK